MRNLVMVSAPIVCRSCTRTIFVKKKTGLQLDSEDDTPGYSKSLEKALVRLFLVIGVMLHHACLCMEYDLFGNVGCQIPNAFEITAYAA